MNEQQKATPVSGADDPKGSAVENVAQREIESDDLEKIGGGGTPQPWWRD